MFLILLDYLKPTDEVDRLRPAHREFLRRHYERGDLLLSGPRNPRTGGVILARTKDREALDTMIAGDPFHREGVAAYTVIEFDPAMAAPELAQLLPPA